MSRQTKVVFSLVGILAYIIVISLAIEFANSSHRREGELQTCIEIQDARIKELEHQLVASAEPPIIPIDNSFLILPLHPDDYKKLTSPIGRRTLPIYGGQFRVHRGLDLAGVWKARILAAADGYISDVYPHPHGKWKGHKTKGGYIEITHADGYVTRYAHMSEVDKRWWVIGTKVAAGAELGRQGNTGLSLAAHLHFEVLRDGVHVNPLVYIREVE